MAGNVSEWCLDAMHWDYTDAPTDGSAWDPDSVSTWRVIRGGCWGGADVVNMAQSAFRNHYDHYYNGREAVGFRIVEIL